MSDLGWGHLPEGEPDPEGGTEQLSLFEPPPADRPDWALSPAEKRAGSEGIKRTKKALERKGPGRLPGPSYLNDDDW